MNAAPERRPSVLLVTKGLDIGGIERMVVSLAQGLRRRGHVVEVVVINGKRNRLSAELVSAGVVVHELAGTDRVGWRGACALFRLVREQRFDVVHVHGPLPAVLVRLVPGAAPTVTTSHTPLEALHPCTRWGWKLSLRRDAASVAVGVAVAESLGSDVEVIPHAPDQYRRSAQQPVATAAPDDVVDVIAVASHRRVKNYPNLLDALRIASGRGVRLRLIAVGEGPDLDANIELAAALGLAERGVDVLFEPPVIDIVTRIAAADVLVVSSDFEGQPLVVSEALAVGTPVIATNVGRVAELVNDDVGRVVPVGDPAALAAALVEMAGDSDLRQRMGAAAQRQAVAWTLDDVLDAHEAVYRKVLRLGPK